MKSNCREVVSHRHATSELLVGYTRFEYVASVPWRTGTTFASPAI